MDNPKHTDVQDTQSQLSELSESVVNKVPKVSDYQNPDYYINRELSHPY